MSDYLYLLMVILSALAAGIATFTQGFVFALSVTTSVFLGLMAIVLLLMDIGNKLYEIREELQKKSGK